LDALELGFRRRELCLIEIGLRQREMRGDKVGTLLDDSLERGDGAARVVVVGEARGASKAQGETVIMCQAHCPASESERHD
jgi:predicted naringenin-chalcone synthase